MATRFVLYVAGESARSSRAASSLRRLCSVAGIPSDAVEIVDVIERPDVADEHGILATPTVVSFRGGSTRRVIGDLSDVDRLASALDVDLNGHRESDAVRTGRRDG